MERKRIVLSGEIDKLVTRDDVGPEFDLFADPEVLSKTASP
jgi:hypothetical protein